MLAAAQRTFESIGIEIAEHLDQRGIKSLEIKAPIPPGGMLKVLDDIILKKRIEDTVNKGMVSNVNTVLSEGAEGTRKTLGYSFGLSNPEAVQYAKEHTNKMSGSIAKSSVKDVRRTISEGIEQGKDLRTVRNELMEKVDGWSKERAETVARTETLSAANQGSLAVMQKAGIEYKEWLAAPDACPFCRSLADQVSTIDHSYMQDDHSMAIPIKERPGYYGTQAAMNTYGDMTTPPVHPRCRCTIAAIPASEVETIDKSFTGKFENHNAEYNMLSDLVNQMDDLGYQYDKATIVTNRAIIENLKHGKACTVKVVKFQDKVHIYINGSNVTPQLQKVWGAYADDVGKILHSPLTVTDDAYKQTQLILSQSGAIKPVEFRFGEGFPAKHKAKIESTFHGLEKKYKPVSDRMSTVGNMPYSGAGDPPIAYTQTIAGGNDIIVFTDESWLMDDVDDMLTRNYENNWTATYGSEGVTNHEFGHRVEHFLKDQKGVSTNLPPTNTPISSVAELQGQEFAEVFAAYESGMYPTNPQVMALEQMLRKGQLIP